MTNDKWKTLWKSDRQDWQTPPSLLEKLYPVFDFDLDVCASISNVKAKRFISPKEDALTTPWNGLCWMNPPYGRNVGHWIARARQMADQRGATVVCLLMSRTDTRWWHEHIPFATCTIFIKGRLKFVGASHNAPAPSCIVVFGALSNPQLKKLSKLGWIVQNYNC